MELSQYMEMFIEESKEHLQSVNDHLLELEKNPEDLAIVNEVFRSAHTLKGMSATMGFEDIANLTHKMENVLDAIRHSKIRVSPEILDVVFKAADQLEEMVMSISSGGDGKLDVTQVVNQLDRIEKGEPLLDETAASVEAPTTTQETVPATENRLQYDDFELTIISQSIEQQYHTYEISVKLREDTLLKAARVFMVFELLEKMGDVIKSLPTVDQLEAEQFEHEFHVCFVTMEAADDLQKIIMKVSEVEEVLVTPVTVSFLDERKVEQDSSVPDTKAAVIENNVDKQIPEPKKETGSASSNHARSKTIRVNIERLDILLNLFEELIIDRGRLQSIASDLKHADLNETVERITRNTGDLQSIILNMRMIPVDTVFNRFPKMVRQLARDLNKQVNLQITGAETELDRTVIDEIGDPLVHLIRNALDHGIESPEVRLAAGKPAEGTVSLRAFHSGNHVFIELEDDGAGINREKVLSKAISNGIITEESGKLLTDRQVNELIMASGFSTADKISDISGRGVGLDVVKTTIESLGGSISIDSTLGKGSLFSVQLPLTLSIISVMLVELSDEIYAVPLSSIIETSIIRSSEIMNAHNQKVIDFRGKVVPLIFLKDIFETERQQEEEFLSVIIVRKGDKLAGLVVDSFIGQQEVVLKSLGNYLTDIFAISGATILGNGQVALIVDCNALIK